MTSSLLPKTKSGIHKYAKTSLQERNCLRYQAEGDADVLTVAAAVNSAQEGNTVLVGDHTDLLVIDGMNVTSISNQNQLHSRRRGLEYEDS